MGSFRGIVGPPSDGRMRLYLVEREREYVDFDPADVSTATVHEEGDGPFPVHELSIPDEAVATGRVDDAEFDELFEAGAPPAGGWKAQVAALVEHQEAASANRSLDGSQFRCCYSVVYR